MAQPRLVGPDVLVIFQGGGYDGCFWEWNALLFHDEEQEEIYVSGRDGAAFCSDSIRGVMNGLNDEFDKFSIFYVADTESFGIIQSLYNTRFIEQICCLLEEAGCAHGLSCVKCGDPVLGQWSYVVCPGDEEEIWCSDCVHMNCCTTCVEELGENPADYIGVGSIELFHGECFAHAFQNRAPLGDMKVPEEMRPYYTYFREPQTRLTGDMMGWEITQARIRVVEELNKLSKEYPREDLEDMLQYPETGPLLPGAENWFE